MNRLRFPLALLLKVRVVMDLVGESMVRRIFLDPNFPGTLPFLNLLSSTSFHDFAPLCIKNVGLRMIYSYLNSVHGSSVLGFGSVS